MDEQDQSLQKKENEPPTISIAEKNENFANEANGKWQSFVNGEEFLKQYLQNLGNIS